MLIWRQPSVIHQNTNINRNLVLPPILHRVLLWYFGGSYASTSVSHPGTSEGLTPIYWWVLFQYLIGICPGTLQGLTPVIAKVLEPDTWRAYPGTRSSSTARRAMWVAAFWIIEDRLKLEQNRLYKHTDTHIHRQTYADTDSDTYTEQYNTTKTFVSQTAVVCWVESEAWAVVHSLKIASIWFYSHQKINSNRFARFNSSYA